MKVMTVRLPSTLRTVLDFVVTCDTWFDSLGQKQEQQDDIPRMGRVVLPNIWPVLCGISREFGNASTGTTSTRPWLNSTYSTRPNHENP